MNRELAVTLGSNTLTVAVRKATDRGELELTIADRSVAADCVRVRPNTWSILVAGRAYLVDLEMRRGKLVVSTRTSSTVATVEDAMAHRLKAVRQGGATASGEFVRAPIAGRIVKVAVVAGDAVEAGATLVILEAMKMENEIKCETAGVVAELPAKVGAVVDAGDLLVRLVAS
jgi:glutaconyl-CoA/methylmalonyl-CoA decarboxylase subunit gamma